MTRGFVNSAMCKKARPKIRIVTYHFPFDSARGPCYRENSTRRPERLLSSRAQRRMTGDSPSLRTAEAAAPSRDGFKGPGMTGPPLTDGAAPQRRVSAQPFKDLSDAYIAAVPYDRFFLPPSAPEPYHHAGEADDPADRHGVIQGREPEAADIGENIGCADADGKAA